MAFEAEGRRRPAWESTRTGSEGRAYLQDYAALLDAVSFPSLVLDHRWNVVHANDAFDALFGVMAPHPTAMPRDNFLRFVLFHPDAGAVLGDREASWCLPMLAHFAEALERHPDDDELRAVRRAISDDPIMDAAYRDGVPRWIRVVGADAVANDGALRPLTHPDPRWGRTYCRVVGETPRTLRAMGLCRLTLVLREPGRPTEPRPVRRGVRRTAARHLRAVPADG
ncbi:MmyB family transcriptional regulator [Streptomyces sp. JNUCC 64]